MASGLPAADHSAVRGLIRDLRAKKHTRGVIAVAATPRWEGEREFSIDGQSVLVRTAPSVLAVRDALTSRGAADWVVVLTDRTAAELPAGVLEHLAGNRLTNLDPFPMLRDAFSASQQEFNLLGLSTGIARAVLREINGAATPAPGAVLTEDHVFATLAKAKFGFAPTEFTPHQVALWSLQPGTVDRYQSWRLTADPVLLDRMLVWLSARLGMLGPLLSTVWRTSGPGQLVPLGLVAALLSDAGQPAAAFPAPTDVVTRIRTRLELELGDATISEQELSAWGDTATLAVAAAEQPGAALTVAEAGVKRLQATALAGRSDVLPSALPARIEHFGVALGAAIDDPADAGADEAWAIVTSHRDARADTAEAPRDVRVGGAALRLLHRLRVPWPQPDSLADWLNAYRTDLSWVDSAVNNAFIGADNARLAQAAHRLVTVARAARTTHDRAFATALARSGAHRESGDGAPLYVEDILDRIVKPLTVPPKGGSNTLTARPESSPVLVVVADGMDAATSNDVVADALRRHRPQWQDCVFAETGRAHVALAALPTVTQFSRCSLLTGALAHGTQNQERAGFAGWLQHQGLEHSGQVLFHKADLDALSKGHALAVDVRMAIEDTKGRPVVACVLNDIDDALDRSDPIGTSWTTQHFKHLEALMSAAAAVGRTIVLVSDHGHVVERREQPSVQRGDQISARYRSAAGVDVTTLNPDEVHVDGPRVLTDGHRAVLAVDEQLRYTRIKAGYHGGAALAEAVIPVSILVNGAIPDHLGLQPAPPATPSWWHHLPEPSPAQASTVTLPARPKKKAASKPVPQTDALFDVGTPVAAQTDTSAPDPVADDVVASVLSSDLFTGQFNRFGRRLDRAAIGTLLRESIAGNGLLSLGRAAEILQVAPTRVGGAVQVLAQVLNTDGVVVLAQQGNELKLERELLLEQFGVAR